MTVRDELEALWLRYRSASRRLLKRGGWSRELRLRSRFDLAPVDLARLADSVPSGKVPDCPSCTNICCGGLENLVTLRLVDLAALIDLGRTDLVQRQKPRFPETLLEARPGLRALEASYLHRALPVLRQVGPDRRCAALTPQLRCGLHPHWPTSCARFPYAMTQDRRRIVWGKRCQSPARRPDPERARSMRESSVAAYDERLRDAVLLHHARPELEQLGMAPFLVSEDEDPFQPEAPDRHSGLRVIP